MFIEFEDRMKPYFENMSRVDDLQMKVRYLDKIYQACIDDAYTEKDYRHGVEWLEKTAKAETNDCFAALLLAYAYKIRSCHGFETGQVVKLEDTLDVDQLRTDLPPVMNEHTRKVLNGIANDEGVERLYNIRISKGHFYPRKIWCDEV